MSSKLVFWTGEHDEQPQNDRPGNPYGNDERRTDTRADRGTGLRCLTSRGLDCRRCRLHTAPHPERHQNVKADEAPLDDLAKYASSRFAKLDAALGAFQRHVAHGSIAFGA